MPSHAKSAPSDSQDASESEEIQNAVRAELRRSPYAATRQIDFTYDDGVLVLSGDVPSYYQRQLALTRVQKMLSHVTIVDRLQVRPSARNSD